MKEIEGKEGEPVDPAVQKKKDQQAWDGNLGLKIPAVLRYDPTGTRVAVTTTDAETRKLVEKQKPWHLPQAEWCKVSACAVNLFVWMLACVDRLLADFEKVSFDGAQ